MQELGSDGYDKVATGVQMMVTNVVLKGALCQAVFNGSSKVVTWPTSDEIMCASTNHVELAVQRVGRNQPQERTKVGGE
eukprot:8830283-Pyramimonas_sp.AAC.1